MNRKEIEAAIACAEHQARAVFGELPEIKWMFAGAESMGVAYPDGHIKIDESRVDSYLAKEPDIDVHFDLVYELCIHEICHVVADKYGSHGHDDVWRGCMARAGFPDAIRFISETSVTKAATASAKKRFCIGQAVSFPRHDGGYVVGTIVRLNKRTMSIAADSGVWRAYWAWADENVEIL